LGKQELIPEKRKKRATVDVTLAVAVMADARGRCILLPPPKNGVGKAAADDIPTLVSKMWHFPTVSAGNNPAGELRRYVATNIGAAGALPLRFTALEKIRHTVTYRAIRVFPFRVEFAELPDIPRAKKILLRDFATLPVSNLTRKVARAALSTAK
jgi:hypothetical protein